MLTQDLISTTRQQIGVLYQQTREIDEANSKIQAAKFKYRDYFNNDVFNCNSTSLFDYVKELEDNFNALLNMSQRGTTQLNLRGERMTQQLTALIQAVRSNGVAVKEHHFQKQSNNKRFAKYQKPAKQLMFNSHQLHQELAEHHEYERRFNEMIFERQAKMKGANQKVAYQLQREMLALHQRLGKCRRAISVIEEKIQMAESRNSGGKR
ncbi:MAG: primosomal replication protein N'' [Phenylobacterium sp.]|jgi:primosomal replication protein N''